MISFALFLLYLLLLLVRPIELLDLQLQDLRPMLLLFILTLAAAVLQAFISARAAAKPVHFFLLIAFTGMVGVSVAVNGWVGGAYYAIEEFSVAAGLFVLAVLNLTSFARLKMASFVLVAGVLFTTVLGINAYHTGTLSEKFFLNQGTSQLDFGEVPELLKQLKTFEERSQADTLTEDDVRPFVVPANEDSGFFLWRMRGLGFLNDPNDLAQALVMCLPFLWLFFRKGAVFRNLLLVWVPVLIMSYGILLTNSRGAILGAASLLFFGLRSVLGTGKTLLAMAGLGIAVLAGIVGGGRSFSTSDESASSRIDFWYEGIVMLKASPVFGVGYGNFTEHSELSAHNSFVLCFAELGMIGFFFWVALLVIAYRSLNQVIELAPSAGTYSQMATLIRASLTGFLVCGWFLSRTYQATLFLLLGMAIACWYGWQLMAKADGQSVKKVEWIPQTFVAMFASMSLIYLFIQGNKLF